MMLSCNAKGPKDYYCTEKVPEEPGGKKGAHAGPHVARAIVGTSPTTEIVRWRDGERPAWNPDYRGR